MPSRDELARSISDYLHEHFPNADIAVKTDGLTASVVFTVTEGAVARHLEVTKGWLDQGLADNPLGVIRESRLAQKIGGLQPNAVLRLGPEGVERVS